MAFVTVKDISKSYNDVKAVSNISFDVNKGELFGFIGPDGAGKTTIFRIIVSLLKQDTGTVMVGDFDSFKDYKKIREITGYMPGRFSLYQDLSVEENLKFYASIFGTTVEENYDLIKDIYIQIEPFKTRLAGKLSGGMKQKLALCCAMIHKPDLLILDEPTTGVDAVSRKEFWEILRKFNQLGITIMVSTPYMDEASLCDRVALIQNGKIMALDTPLAIINNYQHQLWAVASDNMYNLINDLKQYPNTYSVNLFGQYIHYADRNKSFDKQELLKYLQTKNHSNIELFEVIPNIEDCFIEFVNTNL